MVGKSEGESDLEIKVLGLIYTLGLECLLLTRGANGMTLFQTEKSFSIPALVKKVSDVSSAGDTALASLVCGLSRGMSYLEAVKFSNKCASIAVSKFETSPANLDDLNE